MPKKLDISPGDLISMIQEGATKREMANVFDCSIPTITSRIDSLLQEEGVWLKYRDTQHLKLTKLQYQILESISEEDLNQASLAEKVNAFRILKEKENLSQGKPTEIKGLLGFLIQAEEKEKEIEKEILKTDNSKAFGPTETTSGILDIKLNPQTKTYQTMEDDPDYVPAI